MPVLITIVYFPINRQSPAQHRTQHTQVLKTAAATRILSFSKVYIFTEFFLVNELSNKFVFMFRNMEVLVEWFSHSYYSSTSNIGRGILSSTLNRQNKRTNKQWILWRLSESITFKTSKILLVLITMITRVVTIKEQTPRKDLLNSDE